MTTILEIDMGTRSTRNFVPETESERTQQNDNEPSACVISNVSLKSSKTDEATMSSEPDLRSTAADFVTVSEFLKLQSILNAHSALPHVLSLQSASPSDMLSIRTVSGKNFSGDFMSFESWPRCTD